MFKYNNESKFNGSCNKLAINMYVENVTQEKATHCRKCKSSELRPKKQLKIKR